MKINYFKAILRTGVRGAAVLLLGAGVVSAQQVNLSVGTTTTQLPDGTVVPMWGYTCGAVTAGVTCAAANQNAGSGWSPIIITVPTGSDLKINLTNNLPSPVPTSVVIVGQVGGGLGSTGTSCNDSTGVNHGAVCSPSPNHDNQPTTWPIANSGAINSPPPQGPRVQSFAIEVAAGGTALLPTWTAPTPGTYLLESGTHPSIQVPMGLIGMVVVTAAPVGNTAGTAYPGVNYDGDIPLILSEIDPLQNVAVAKAVNTNGFSEIATHGPFAQGGVANINVVDPGAGYKTAPTVTLSGGGATTQATAKADIDTDPSSPTYGQVLDIQVLTPGVGYTSAPSVSISGGTPIPAKTIAAAKANAFLTLANDARDLCSGGAAACYPPVVNYTPLYYLFNGVAFDKTSASKSLFAATPPGSSMAPITGNVLVRFVNAGVRMHVPAIAGSETGGTAAAGGFTLIAEDGNPLPGVGRIQSEVFMAAGKTYDVMINAPAASKTALPVFDQELSLSGNATSRDAGMLAYLNINGASLLSAGVISGAIANPDTYASILPCSASPCTAVSISDPSKGVIANDVNVYGVKVITQPTKGTVSLAENGTFVYTPNVGWVSATTDLFVYQANGNGPTATVTLNTASMESAGGITVNDDAFSSNLSKSLSIKAPGILANDLDAAGYPLTVVASSVTPQSGLTVTVNKYGGFDASIANKCGNVGGCTYTFTYKAQNSQGTVSSSAATVTITFQQGNGPNIQLVDGGTKQTLTGMDYRWVVEEDRTFYVDPTKTTNTSTTSGTTAGSYGTNFHTSYMPLIAQGCTITGSVSCGKGQTVLGNDVAAQTAVDPSELHLDTTKRYYISVLPGDAGNPFVAGNGSACLPTTDPKYDVSSCGHGMGGSSLYWNGTAWASPTAPTSSTVSVIVEPSPLPPAKLTVFVFEDDFPLNGEQDAGGGVDILAPNEPGLGGFNITIFDDAGGTGDATGQVDYDMFNQPLSNSLAGTKDPATGWDACPISPKMGSRTGTLPNGQTDVTQTGLAGVIVTCPKFESDNKTLSPLAGQAVIANMMPGRYGIVATPGSDRIGRGEEWLQTNTLDGQKAHDSFLKVGEPAFFQEYGPASFHVRSGLRTPRSLMAALRASATVATSILPARIA